MDEANKSSGRSRIRRPRRIEPVGISEAIEAADETLPQEPEPEEHDADSDPGSEPGGSEPDRPLVAGPHAVTDTSDTSVRDATLTWPDLSRASIEAQLPAPPNSIKHYFDQLKINFLARYSNTVKSVLFVAAARGDGTSTAAFNFAASLAQDSDLRVLFINADLREPAHNGTEANGSMHWDTAAAVGAQQGNLHIMPGGRGYADPAVLFQSKRFENFMSDIVRHYNYVVIDGPALDEAPESVALTTKVDGVILVVDARHTRRKIALHAKRRIEEVGGKLLGIVLNRRTFYIPTWLYRRV